MPRLCRYVVHPSGVSRWECQNVKGVAFLLVGVRNRVADGWVLCNCVFNCVGADPLAGVAVGAVDDALPASVSAQPEQTVVQFGDRIRRRATNFVIRALDAL